MRIALLLAALAVLCSSGCASGDRGADGWDHLADLKAMRARTRWHRATVRSDLRFQKLQIRCYRGSVEVDRFRIHCLEKPKIRELSVPGTINAGRHATVRLGETGAVIKRVEFLGRAIDKGGDLVIYGRAQAVPAAPN